MQHWWGEFWMIRKNRLCVFKNRESAKNFEPRQPIMVFLKIMIIIIIIIIILMIINNNNSNIDDNK